MYEILNFIYNCIRNLSWFIGKYRNLTAETSLRIYQFGGIELRMCYQR